MKISVDFDHAPKAKRLAGANRVSVSISVMPGREESNLFPALRFIQLQTPAPVRFYQFPESSVVTTATRRTAIHPGNESLEIPVEAFCKAALPLKSWVNGATLNLPYPGTTFYGWINPNDVKTFADWMNKELESVADRIQQIINEEIANVNSARPSGITAERNSTAAPAPAPAMAFERPKIVSIANCRVFME